MIDTYLILSEKGGREEEGKEKEDGGEGREGVTRGIETTLCARE